MQFKNNEFVRVTELNSELTGKKGKVLGFTSDLPVLGKIYIVNFGEIFSEVYPFQALGIPEIHLESIEGPTKCGQI